MKAYLALASLVVLAVAAPPQLPTSAFDAVEASMFGGAPIAPRASNPLSEQSPKQHQRRWTSPVGANANLRLRWPRPGASSSLGASPALASSSADATSAPASSLFAPPATPSTSLSSSPLLLSSLPPSPSLPPDDRILPDGTRLSALKQMTPPSFPMPPADTVVAFETTRGTFHVTVHPRWSPRGAARFLKLVAEGFYDGCAVYRVIHGFIAQFGLPADPARNAGHVPFKDDSRAKISNTLGTVSFAAHGPNSRNTQIFINLMDNAQLDRSKFTPFAVVDSHGYNMQVGERVAEEGRGRREGERRGGEREGGREGGR